MEFLIVFGLAVALVAIAFLGLAVRMLIQKKGKFPNLHIGSNKHMKARGITCAQTFDKMEQAKAKRQLSFKKLSILNDVKGGC
ncbi:hypothetical protein [uncultured Sunxiuqinia sp.]|uniref:hypothetical protein n=1 Tax=uncultured Sunxiuqinia sp. TaxID=1573825 RepID=UPI002AA79129|nr:hypothetical protein [uncultured Sunxiuqinia sp.]